MKGIKQTDEVTLRKAHGFSDPLYNRIVVLQSTLDDLKRELDKVPEYTENIEHVVAVFRPRIQSISKTVDIIKKINGRIQIVEEEITIHRERGEVDQEDIKESKLEDLYKLMQKIEDLGMVQVDEALATMGYAERRSEILVNNQLSIIKKKRNRIPKDKLFDSLLLVQSRVYEIMDLPLTAESMIDIDLTMSLLYEIMLTEYDDTDLASPERCFPVKKTLDGGQNVLDTRYVTENLPSTGMYDNGAYVFLVHPFNGNLRLYTLHRYNTDMSYTRNAQKFLGGGTYRIIIKAASGYGEYLVFMKPTRCHDDTYIPARIQTLSASFGATFSAPLTILPYFCQNLDELADSPVNDLNIRLNVGLKELYTLNKRMPKELMIQINRLDAGIEGELFPFHIGPTSESDRRKLFTENNNEMLSAPRLTKYDMNNKIFENKDLCKDPKIYHNYMAADVGDAYSYYYGEVDKKKRPYARDQERCSILTSTSDGSLYITGEIKASEKPNRMAFPEDAISRQVLYGEDGMDIKYSSRISRRPMTSHILGDNKNIESETGPPNSLYAKQMSIIPSDARPPVIKDDTDNIRRTTASGQIQEFNNKKQTIIVENIKKYGFHNPDGKFQIEFADTTPRVQIVNTFQDAKIRQFRGYKTYEKKEVLQLGESGEKNMKDIFPSVIYGVNEKILQKFGNDKKIKYGTTPLSKYISLHHEEFSEMEFYTKSNEYPKITKTFITGEKIVSELVFGRYIDGKKYVEFYPPSKNIEEARKEPLVYSTEELIDGSKIRFEGKFTSYNIFDREYERIEDEEEYLKNILINCEFKMYDNPTFVFSFDLSDPVFNYGFSAKYYIESLMVPLKEDYTAIYLRKTVDLHEQIPDLSTAIHLKFEEIDTQTAEITVDWSEKIPGFLLPDDSNIYISILDMNHVKYYDMVWVDKDIAKAKFTVDTLKGAPGDDKYIILIYMYDKDNLIYKSEIEVVKYLN